jgi:hypothetical protein
MQLAGSKIKACLYREVIVGISDTGSPKPASGFLAVAPRESIVPPDALYSPDSPLVLPADVFSLVLGKLKRAALMFDRIEIVGLRGIARYLQSNQLDELDFLLDRGVIGDCYAHLSDLYRQRCEERYRVFWDDERNYLWSDSPKEHREHRDYEVGRTNCRRAAKYLIREKGWEAVALMEAGLQGAGVLNHGSEPIAHFVLNAMPLPNENTPWEAILEYRNEPDARGQFYRLKTWMNDMGAHPPENPRHFEDELRSRIYEYDHFMKLHQIKTQSGILETLVITAAEVLGNLVKISWGDAARALFNIKRQQVSLLEEELAAPNREIAYIVTARQNFGQRETS